MLKKTQSTWKSAKTFQSPFTQVVRSKWMGTSDPSEGVIYVIKPNRFRWESKTDGSIQILHDKKLTLVQPKAQRGRTVVDIYPDFSKHADPKFLDFLAGTVDFAKQYNAKYLSSRGKIITVNLEAKKKGQPSYVAEIDRKSYLLLALSYEDDSTVTRMDFSSPKINEKIDEKLFEHTPKKEDIVNRHK